MNGLRLTAILTLWAMLLRAQPQLLKPDAEKLARLPLSCLEKPFPYKTGIVLDERLSTLQPKQYHPVFFGCFDWHSAAHGYWSLARLLKLFPDLKQKDSIENLFDQCFNSENIATEIKIFEQKINSSFERPYGWAWLLQLHTEFYTWKHPKAKIWLHALNPLAKKIKELTTAFLTKIVYPIRSGEHANLAFGLKLIYDNAKATADIQLAELIKSKALEFYLLDRNCPISWEPSGYDFLSPCLEEADLMRRVLPPNQFQKWLAGFLPEKHLKLLQPAVVLDRTDGKLVHLDGLNFSRSTCLWGMMNYCKSKKLFQRQGEQHFEQGWRHLFSGDYAGEHWLASFAIYAITQSER